MTKQYAPENDVIKYVRWSQNGGYAVQVTLPNARVRLVADGNGEYATCQRAPTGYTEKELVKIAERVLAEHVRECMFPDPYYGNVVEGVIPNKVEEVID